MKQLTAEDAKQSLNAHVAAKGAEIFEKYGPHIGWKELLRILEDRTCVPYPCQVLPAPTPLPPSDGERGPTLDTRHSTLSPDHPDDGFTIFVHPYYMTQLDRVPHLVLYQLVAVNYGEFA